MLRNKLVRSDGSIIDSSAIISCEFTEEVNSNTNLTVGDVTASELAVEILSTAVIQQDEVLTYSIVEDGVETKIGVFKAEKPTVATRTTMRFTAYDNIIKTEKVFSNWLRDNQDLFPMTLLKLVQYACSYCDVVLATTDFPQADLQVEAFSADNITCRQILMWASAISGRFVRANTEGELEFAWYAEATNIEIVSAISDATSYVEVKDDGAGYVSLQSPNITVSASVGGHVALTVKGLSVTTSDDSVTLTSSSIVIPFFRDKLSYESYTTDLIERVQINHSEDDVGVIYPEDATGNCFTISQNMILGVSDRVNVTQIARDLYSHLKDITYVPFNITVPKTIRVRAGDIVSITDTRGNSFAGYVMKMSVTSSGTTLTATGDKSYEGNAAVSSEKYGNLTGKILSISKSVDGLVIVNKDLNGKVSTLEADVNGFKTTVENTYLSGTSFEKYKSTVEQTDKEVKQKFEALDKYRNNTEAYIKTGLLSEDDDPVPVYGIQVGQETTNAAGEKVFNKYAQFTSDRLSFYDQSDREVAYIGDQKMFITQAEITGEFKEGGFVDVVMSDKSVVTKWVGGG